MLKTLGIKVHKNHVLFFVLLIWLAIFSLSSNPWHLLNEYGYFFLLGVTGAVIANATGAGGGIIFIPFFTMLGLEGSEALGTSILIQCFGMTAGAISWLTSSHIIKQNSWHLNRLIYQIIIICGIVSIIGILFGQYLFVPESPVFMSQLFKIFSIVFGFVLLGITFVGHKHTSTQFDLAKMDIALLAMASFIGGLITAWISVGIGEIIAIVLILRRYPTMVAISMGVAMSSISVLAAAYHHIAVIHSVNWQVLLFAVPGAILGGSFAYLLSEKLGPLRLKIFFAIWIMLTGFFM